MAALRYTATRRWRFNGWPAISPQWTENIIRGFTVVWGCYVAVSVLRLRIRIYYTVLVNKEQPRSTVVRAIKLSRRRRSVSQKGLLATRLYKSPMMRRESWRVDCKRHHILPAVYTERFQPVAHSGPLRQRRRRWAVDTTRR